MIDVYVAGYPRSGTHWMARLLSDLLDSPIRPSNRKRPLNYNHCQRGEGGFRVNHGHLRPDNCPYDVEATVHITRDPRDVAVSNMYYQRREPSDAGLMKVIKWMCQESKMVAYDKWVTGWLVTDAAQIKYEQLHSHPVEHMKRNLERFIGTPSSQSLVKVVNRQHFAQWVDTSPHVLRKGIVGDWRNHFTRRVGEYMHSYLGALLIGCGYVDNDRWFEELPEEVEWRSAV